MSHLYDDYSLILTHLFAAISTLFIGDQIVGATVYFDNMSSEETAELLKTLNRHKVGLKLQNKGDKSPYCSPLSTPCRSPMGTLTWEGTTRFGGSSPDIILVSSFFIIYLFFNYMIIDLFIKKATDQNTWYNNIFLLPSCLFLSTEWRG